jgi:hypothetical protein
VLIRWIRRNADNTTNPLTPTATNLKATQTEYAENTAALVTGSTAAPAIGSKRISIRRWQKAHRNVQLFSAAAHSGLVNFEFG